MIDAVDTAREELSPPSSTSAAVAAAYLRGILAGDRPAAAAAVDLGVAGGLGFPELLLGVVAPAQHEVGARWQRGELTVAQEHWATEVAVGEVARLRQHFPPRHALGAAVVVAAPEGERHALAPLCLAALFAWRGWHVDLLGGDLPAAELARFVTARRPAVVALSVTLAASLPAAAAAARAVAALDPAPALLLGGTAFGRPPALPAGFPEAAVVADALAGLELAERLATPSGGPDLATYLATVGRRIQSLRRLRGLSQAALGEAAGLTRSYLSAVEQGRQNITLDAALRLASALRVSVAGLVSEDPSPQAAARGELA